MRGLSALNFCRTSHEVRGLKFWKCYFPMGENECRTSHEVRGLKLQLTQNFRPVQGSHLTRGAWIEILSLSPRARSLSSRTSHEVRGLKSPRQILFDNKPPSHLTRGAWIEIAKRCGAVAMVNSSHLTRGAWIEIVAFAFRK